jgi:hypothetical protein
MRGLAALLLTQCLACSFPDYTFAPRAETSVAEDSTVADSGVTPSDTFVADDTAMPITETSVVDTAVEMDTATMPEVAVDTGPPECTVNIECPCGRICSAGKCVDSTDCTKDSHFCPTGKTCTCVGGVFRINGTGVPAGAAVVAASPSKISDNGADLILRNYEITNVPLDAYGMLLSPENCGMSWFYKNVVLQCITMSDAPGNGIRLSRRGDPSTCRPPSPPELFVDQITLGTGLYTTFTDLEYKTVRLRKVTAKAGLLFDTWGPGEIGELIIQDSPNLYAELQGKVRKVTVMNSPNFIWWTKTPTEDRSTWPKIPIFYDKASCPIGRSLVKSTTANGVDETCAM